MMTPRALLSSAQYSIFLLAAIDVIRCHSISFDVIDWTLAFAIELSATGSSLVLNILLNIISESEKDLKRNSW